MTIRPNMAVVAERAPLTGLRAGAPLPASSQAPSSRPDSSVAVSTAGSRVIGEAGSLEELVALFAEWRRAHGISQLELDERAGLAPGHVGKLEVGASSGRKSWSRQPGWKTFPRWLSSLGLHLQVVVVEEPKPGSSPRCGPVIDGAKRVAALRAARTVD